MELPNTATSKEQLEALITISLKTGSEKELATRKTLEQLLVKYPLKKWILRREVMIEEGVRAHAFPIVTISERKTEEAILAQFLHEQIHWIEKGKEQNMNMAVEELKISFPNAPVGRPAGADNEQSTYRHLIVCRLEYLALTELLGEDKAKEIVQKNPNYTWVRRTILESGSTIDSIINKYFPETMN